jgi:hypothetical protein
MIALLDPLIVSNLRHFAIVDASITEAGVVGLKQSNLRELLPQLEVLSFDEQCWTNPEMTFLHRAASRTLIDCCLRNLDRDWVLCSNVVNVRIWDSFIDNDDAEDRTELYLKLDYFSFSLERNQSTSLRSVYLDESLRPSSALPLKASAVMAHLVAVCRERKIELVFEPVPRDFMIDPCISAEFVKRQEIIRRNNRVGNEAP